MMSARPATAPPGNPPAHPGAVSITDSLTHMDDLIDARKWTEAQGVGTFIYTAAAATPAQKARAARAIANSYGEQNNSGEMVNWYRNSLRYDPTNQSVLTILRGLGVTP